MAAAGLRHHPQPPAAPVTALWAPPPHVVESLIDAAVVMAAATAADQWLLLPAVPGCAVGCTPSAPLVGDAMAFHRWLRKLTGGVGVLVAEVPRRARSPSFAADVKVPVDAPALRSPDIVLPRAPTVTWALWRVVARQR